MNEHLGGAYESGDANTIMPDVWGWALVAFEVKSLIDIGSGYGHCAKWFNEHGLCQVKSIDGDTAITPKYIGPLGTLLIHDYTVGPAPIAQPFDLAWSAEFLEHVDEKFMANYMATFQLARRAIVTHAEPGQAGHHHVNCKPDSYWVKAFAAYGFEHRADETALLRRTDRWRAGWGRRTLMSFERI